jgi:hypothetical protein
MNGQNNDQISRGSVLDMINQIKEGRLDPQILNKEERQVCVEVLMGEGVNAPNMAQIFKVSDKTIRRDVHEIRERYGVSPSEDLVKQCVGELLMHMRIHREFLMRLARSKEGSVGERAQSEFYAAQMTLQYMGKLQSLGYLPEKPQAVVGDFYHHNTQTQEEVQQQIIDLEKVLQADPKLLGEKLKAIKDDLAKSQPPESETSHES